MRHPSSRPLRSPWVRSLSSVLAFLLCLAPSIARASSATRAPRPASTVPTLAGDLRAIEAIRWAHRTWPQGNPGDKPGLDDTLPSGAFQVRADDEARKLVALDRFWHRVITPAQV